MSSSASDASDSAIVTVEAPFSVPLRRVSTSIESVGRLAPPHRWGGARERYYIHVPTTSPCDALWHLPPSTAGSSALQQYTPTDQRGPVESPESQLPDPTGTALDKLVSKMTHETATHDQPQHAVQLVAFASDDCVDPPPLMTVAESCAHSMVELLYAMRLELASHVLATPDEGSGQGSMLGGMNLSTTPLSIGQVKAFYPLSVQKLNEVHFAIFGAFKPVDGSDESRFVADKTIVPHAFDEIVGHLSEYQDSHFIDGFATWLNNAIAASNSQVAAGESSYQ